MGILTTTEIVPQILSHLNIAHVSLASHSGGVIYLLNTMLMYPHLLHPRKPYVCFFAPWVHPSHSKIKKMRVTELLPTPLIGKFASVAQSINKHVIPWVGLSSGLLRDLKTSILNLNSDLKLAPVPLEPSVTHSRAPTTERDQNYLGPALDDLAVVHELRKYITIYLFAECVDGISADAQLFIKGPHPIPWCLPSLSWSDMDYFVPLFSKVIDGNVETEALSREWVIDAFHAENDNMIGEKGRNWFDNCWLPASNSGRNSKSFEYRSAVVKKTDHNFLMDPAHGASEKWLQRVKASFLPPVEV